MQPMLFRKTGNSEQESSGKQSEKFPRLNRNLYFTA